MDKDIILNQLFTFEITRVSNEIKEEEQKTSGKEQQNINPDNTLILNSYLEVLIFLKKERFLTNGISTHIKETREGAIALLFCFLEDAVCDGLKRINLLSAENSGRQSQDIDAEKDALRNYISYLKDLKSVLWEFMHTKNRTE